MDAAENAAQIPFCNFTTTFAAQVQTVAASYNVLAVNSGGLLWQPMFAAGNASTVKFATSLQQFAASVQTFAVSLQCVGC